MWAAAGYISGELGSRGHTVTAAASASERRGKAAFALNPFGASDSRAPPELASLEP